MNAPPPIRRPPRISLAPAGEIVAYAGIAPLVLCPLAIAFLPQYGQRFIAQQVAVAYGAVVLAALGAVHFGLALSGRLAWSVGRALGAALPAVFAVAAVVLGGERGLALLVVALGVFWLYEHRSVGDELPQDYLQLRRNLTLAGCVLLAITMILSDSVGLF
jgi:O-antigen ligase